ncbi:hypothetical protein PUN28_015168 [Cardiocondyla obscurior]|uniref:Uncharacterized protein n=1 Tax=Cardiocondyla obscurior TaxID=286306 RepID=A0AAW2EXD3_9HYME
MFAKTVRNYYLNPIKCDKADKVIRGGTRPRYVSHTCTCRQFPRHFSDIPRHTAVLSASAYRQRKRIANDVRNKTKKTESVMEISLTWNIINK